MRGDRPHFILVFLLRFLFTPHARGSTLRANPTSRSAQVYPACAGIDLYATRKLMWKTCLPRMRGDRPLPFSLSTRKEAFTPHARGSTLPIGALYRAERVYPACAGIDL